MSEEAFIECSRDFSLKLFKELYYSLGEKSTSYLYSPLVTQACLTMIYMAAEDETAQEIATLLGYDLELSKIDVAAFIRILVEQANDEEFVEYACRIYLHPNYNVYGLYSSVMKHYFFATIDSFDNENCLETVKKMNAWVSDETKGKINEIVSGDFDCSEKKLFFLDSLYFKGNWLYQFDKNLTKPKQFWITEQNSITVDTMETINNFNYARLDQVKLSVLEMVYEDSELSLLILLFDAFDEKEHTEKYIKSLSIFDIVDVLYLKKVHVFLPKFEVEYAFDIKDTLKQMGLKSLFESTANLKGLVEGEAEGLCVDSIIQVAKLKIDEEGANVPDAIEPNEVQEVFEVNKPFYFILKHRYEHTTIFSGCIKSFDAFK